MKTELNSLEVNDQRIVEQSIKLAESLEETKLSNQKKIHELAGLYVKTVRSP